MYDLEKNSNWLLLISKKAFPSLLFLSSSLSVEVSWDCVADTVEGSFSPFSLHRCPKSLEKSETHFSGFPYTKVTILLQSDQ